MLDAAPESVAVARARSAKTTSEDGTADLLAFPNPAVLAMTIQAPPGTELAIIFDILGRQVAHLQVAAGAVVWDLRDASGHRVAPGVYVIATDSLNGRLMRRVTVL